MLKISTNSMRRARWDAKLGYYKSPKPFPVSFSSLFSDGGIIGCVECIIQRVYPLLFMEKLQNGNIIFHNEKTEMKAADNHMKLRNLQLEKLSVSVQKEFEILQEKEENKKLKNNKRDCQISLSQVEDLNTGEELYEVLKCSSEDGISEADLNARQRNLLYEYKDKLQNKNQVQFQEMMKKKIDEALEENKVY
ncbi:breast cancer type 2 susceptibility protein-like [Centruroides sculpturatus]|uniref:breast cancer type 2 susceptibility protein-like n=1 Tax=Centruroides sculpturatus TaxID=218467 RepID=UPI000C6DA0CE|nr:breast cancer type 2 susceptibility protein-like [Centruroides sculpturatus]